MSIETNPIAVAITGASGSAYALRLIESLLQAGEPLYLMVSQAAQVVLRMESGLELPSQPAEIQRILCERFNATAEQLQVFGRQQWMAPVASGSNPPRAMVVCPCTVGALSAIACGASNDLMERAADVVLKERRKLILVVRETPFSEIHLENMLKLSRMGAVIMPANPGFYHNPQRVEDIVDFMVSRILDQLGVENRLSPRWGE
ncbi:MAG: UbiX family flavin prenyltransferase [Candidatus Thiodiazotropha lotti]|uniref:Flavin prenyltransferase UbiX n=1 Tax=Candidatus Thiodiazotropha endoloripes TaxID=1818881 RepID=A0A1E2UP94_9GAMM|nr:flavin prenyltransferase UbiX [Candidatus Thiodiazotropha endoloripes]MCG7899911.1 UbiX family flavin prenyltransferase [Candidatus Thiodiazotropha weberae]MCG7993379.1 UbiX family flavin prenyltransferase [Candidatus Thiodiazotropha lotti]MCG7901049.1 UbiX family flavin prenyltransferase [Candidatus Thiodiazotropha weberae]MCG7913352.1 UbiX family flavin prenyltransferase [Candidatus Thiodiazotropha weberae]MCG7998103.1 UbiX family flavin prenyltransferase [Candidatus Thiodiazotropha lotti